MNIYAFSVEAPLAVLTILLAYYHYKKIPICDRPIVKYGLPILIVLLLAPIYC